MGVIGGWLETAPNSLPMKLNPFIFSELQSAAETPQASLQEDLAAFPWLAKNCEFTKTSVNSRKLVTYQSGKPFDFSCL
jgi:hypothetical protein